jgi:ABC-2 type transport system ATP-binding protein
MSSSSPIFLEKLVKTYHKAKGDKGSDVHALKGVTLEMRPGEILGLLGPNGAGKTTLISILTTLETATSGVAHVFGLDVQTKEKKVWQSVKNSFGLVPQELINHGFFSVLEVLKFVSGYHGIRDNSVRIEYLLKRLALWDHREKKVSQLSGGMKRRFLIAKALVHSPKLILLDEPTAGVDIELRNTLWTFVKELHAQGTSILLTTHYLEEAEELCDRVAIIDNGEIRKVGPTRELIKSLTQRRVHISLKSEISKVSSPYLISQTATELVFKLPSTMVLGELLSTINLETNKVTDFKIDEGTLQEAFLQVLGEARA